MLLTEVRLCSAFYVWKINPVSHIFALNNSDGSKNSGILLQKAWKWRRCLSEVEISERAIEPGWHWCECPCCDCSPQSLSAPTLSSSCLGTASRSRWSPSRCTGCSAGKPTSWSTASLRERDALMCARQSWVPFAFWPSTCIMPSSLTGMTFAWLANLSALSAEPLNSINTSIFLYCAWIIYFIWTSSCL